MLFDDEFSTVPFIREGTIPPNWTDIVQHSSQSGAPENIDLKDTWSTTNIEEDSSETQIHEQNVAPENNNKMVMLSHSKPHVEQILAR